MGGYAYSHCGSVNGGKGSSDYSGGDLIPVIIIVAVSHSGWYGFVKRGGSRSGSYISWSSDGVSCVVSGGAGNSGGSGANGVVVTEGMVVRS